MRVQAQPQPRLLLLALLPAQVPVGRGARQQHESNGGESVRVCNWMSPFARGRWANGRMYHRAILSFQTLLHATLAPNQWRQVQRT